MCNLKPHLSLNVVWWHLILRAHICALPLANCVRRTNRDFSPSVWKVFLLRGAKIGLCLGFGFVLVVGFFVVSFLFVVACHCFGFFDYFFFYVHVITLFCPTSYFKYLGKIFLLLGLEWAFPIAREPQTFIGVKQRLYICVWFKKKK